MILLDTYMVLALLGQVGLVLPTSIADELHAPSRKIVSVATIWEIAIKTRLGKMRLAFEVMALPELLASIDIALLEIKPAHTLASISPMPSTKDPFDRLLLGVCATESMKLLTIDRALADHPLAWRQS